MQMLHQRISKSFQQLPHLLRVVFLLLILYLLHVTFKGIYTHMEPLVLLKIMCHIQFSLEEREDKLLLPTVVRVNGTDARQAVSHKAADVSGLDERRVPPDGVESPNEDVMNEGHVGSEEALDIAFKG